MSSTPVNPLIAQQVIVPQQPVKGPAAPVAPRETPQAEPEDGFQPTMPAVEEPPPRKEPISADMAQMLEDIEGARQRDREEMERRAAQALASHGVTAASGSSTAPTALLAFDEPVVGQGPGSDGHGGSPHVGSNPKHASRHGHHAHSEGRQTALTGGYIGATAIKGEVVHHGQQAVSHATGAVAGHAVDASGAAGHAVEHGSQIASAKAEAVHAAATARAEAAHAAATAKAEAAHAGASAKAEAAHAAATAKAEAVEGAVEATAQMGALATAAAVGGALGSVVVGVGMTVIGSKHLVEGIKNKDAEQVLEGSGGLVLGAKSGLTALTLGGAVAGEGVLATAAHAVYGALTPLGVAHGAIDTAIGARQIYQGVKGDDKNKVVKGLLNVGMGVSLGAAAITGGIPALVVAGGMLTAKVLHSTLTARKAQKAAEQAGQQPPPGGVQPPAASAGEVKKT